MQSVQTAGAAPTFPPLAGNGDEDGDAAGFVFALGSGTAASLTTSLGVTTAACASAGATSSATGDPADSSIDDSSCKSSSDDLKKLAPLVQGLPPAQQEAAEKAMDRPLVAARMLKDGSPAEKKAAQAYFDANPTLKTALDTAAHGGKADGNISSHDISAFIGKMSDQQNRAVNTVTQYQKDYPNADGQSLQLVRQSALLQAYMPVLQGNSPDKDGKTGKYMTQDGLRAVLGDTGLPSVLRGAANTFSQPGMFEMLDQGGLDGHALATHNADGNVSEQNIIDWVSKQAPTTGGQFASTISDAATRGAVANVDTSQLNGDVFQNPQDYTGAQKAAVLVQLQDKQQQLQAGSDLKNNDKTNDAIQKDISQLSNDPDVQNYLAQAVPAGEKQIVGSDPSLQRAVVTMYQNDFLSGKMLQTELSAVSRNNSDDKNAKQTAGSALSDFEAQSQFDADLSDNRTATAQQIVGGNAELTSQLQDDYQRDFSQGGELAQLQNQKGADLGTSLQTTQSDEQTFEGVLDPAFVQSQSAQYASTMSSEALQDDGSGKAVVSALKSGGDADTSDIAESISELAPAQLYGSGGTGLTASDTRALVSSFLDDLDHGSSVQDACGKFDPGNAKFDATACDGTVMAKLQSNPAAVQGVQTMLQGLAAGALGVAPPAIATAGTAGYGATSASDSSTTTDDYAATAGSGFDGTGPAAQPASTTGGNVSGTPDGAVMIAQSGLTGSEKAQDGIMYAGLGLGLGSMATIPANALNNRYWDGQAKTDGTEDGKAAADASKGANAARISMAGETAGGLGGVFGAATMLPGVADQIRSGQGGEAALSIGASARGIVQGGALALNTGQTLARSGQVVRQIGTLGITQVAKQVGANWTGDALGRAAGSAAGRVAGQVVGRVGGMAAAEAIGAAAGPVGWAIDGVLGIGFAIEAIVEAVKKAHEKKEMANTVNPTLKQYGIPTV